MLTLRSTLLASLTFLGILGANATSLGRSPPPNPKACEVTAQFKEALPRDGKVVWIFEKISESGLKPCRGLENLFSVWIWAGSYSTLSKGLVYPLSITEPKPGSEVILTLENLSIRESLSAKKVAPKSVTGWFLSGNNGVRPFIR